MRHDIVSDLNLQQAQAVLHRTGPAIVLAGPGSGKTAVLTRRAAHLVKEGAAPESILLLTFSRAAAREMLHRAKALDPRCEHISGGTFHSVATKILNANVHIFGLDKPFTILDPEDVVQIVKKLTQPVKEGPQFDSKGNFNPASDYERIIREFCDVERPLPPNVQPITGRIETSARIDMRARLLRTG